MRLIAMLAAVCAPFFGFASLFPESDLSILEADKPATIKVLLSHQVDGALVEVRGPHKVYNPHDGRLLTTRLMGRRYHLSPLPNGIKWGNDFQRIHQIRIMPKSNRSSILVNGIQYKGCLDAYLVEDKISIVNEVAVEDYLKSTLTTQMKHTMAEEVMDAIAIAARTNAYCVAMKNKKRFWHVRADDTGYEGMGVTQLSGNVERAIDTSRYLVMLHKGHPFATGWNENCAGKTTSYSTVYRKKTDGPEGVEVPMLEKERKNFHWCFSLARDELSKVLQMTRVTDINLFCEDTSRKVYGMRIKGESGVKDLDFHTLQTALGKGNLISNDFTIKINKDKVLFEGYGEGDGVGLCLYASKKLAKSGEIAPKILEKFYPDTHIEKVRSFEQLDKNRIKGPAKVSLN